MILAMPSASPETLRRATDFAVEAEDTVEVGDKVRASTLSLEREATPVELVPYVKGRPDVVPCFLWASVNWGKWALVFGKTAAARVVSIQMAQLHAQDRSARAQAGAQMASGAEAEQAQSQALTKATHGVMHFPRCDRNLFQKAPVLL